MGIIPHYIEKNHETFKQLMSAIPNSILIDVQAPCMETLAKISECETILSSAMHGLIIADSYGIPNLRIKASKRLAEDTNYKFLDYYSVYGIQPFSFDIRSQEGLEQILSKTKAMPNFIKNHYQVPRDRVERIQKDLIATFPYASFLKLRKLAFKIKRAIGK